MKLRYEIDLYGPQLVQLKEMGMADKFATRKIMEAMMDIISEKLRPDVEKVEKEDGYSVQYRLRTNLFTNDEIDTVLTSLNEIKDRAETEDLIRDIDKVKQLLLQ